MMTFGPTFLSNLLLILTGFGGAFIAALWIALVIWTYRDIRSRARDPLVQILSTLLVAVLTRRRVLTISQVLSMSARACSMRAMVAP